MSSRAPEAPGTPGTPGEHGEAGAAPARTRRPALWLLLLPAAFFCAAPLVANRIEPRVLGVPFLLAWTVAATLLSPLVIWAVGRLDPLYRTGAAEPIPADRGRTDGAVAPAPPGRPEGGTGPRGTEGGAYRSGPEGPNSPEGGAR